MDWLEIVARAGVFVVACYILLLSFRLLRRLFRSALNVARNVQGLPRQAGSAAAKAVDAAKTVKDGFVDGYKTRR